MTHPRLDRSVMAKLAIAAVLSVLFAAGFGLMLVGAPKELAEDDVNVKEAVAFAIYEYNRGSNDMYASRLMKVHNATMQLVNGIKYDMFVEIGRTTCKKPTTDVNACALHEKPVLAKSKLCHFVVLNHIWTSKITTEKSECN